MKRLVNFIAPVVVLTSLLVGCPPSSDPTLGTLRIINNSSHAIIQFFASPSTSSTWGNNVLSSSIGAGSSRNISNVPTNTNYDFRAVFDNGGVSEAFQVVFDVGETRPWTLTDGDIVGGSSASADILAKEIQAHDLVNAERTSRSVAALTMHEGLREVARAHSEDMIARNFFDHTNPDGDSPFDRIQAAGITYSTAGENIASNTGYGSDTVSVAVNGWMNSEGHRNNILNANYTHAGMGVATDGNGKYVYTQVFKGGGNKDLVMKVLVVE